MAGRGTVTDLGDGRYRVFCSVGSGPDGKPIRHTKVIHGTKKEAHEYLVGILRERDLGRFRKVDAPTLAEYLDRWLDAHKGSVKQRTAQDYAYLMNLYVKPDLGKTRLDRLSTLMIQRLYSDMSKRGLSPRTVRMVHAVLGTALRQAIRWKLLHESPTADVILPRNERKERPALDTDGARRLLDALSDSGHGAVLAFAIVTGMRPSEYQALRPEDVDLRTGIVQVRRSIEWLRGGEWRISDNKTAGSQRQMEIPPEIVELVRDHLTRIPAMRERTRGLWKEHGLLFPGPTGTPISGRILRKALRDAIRSAGLPEDLTPYSLRHSCATVLLEAGTSAKLVSERLGHSTIVLTMNTYSHVTPTMQSGVSDTLGATLFRNQSPGEGNSSSPSK